MNYFLLFNWRSTCMLALPVNYAWRGEISKVWNISTFCLKQSSSNLQTFHHIGRNLSKALLLVVVFVIGTSLFLVTCAGLLPSVNLCCFQFADFPPLALLFLYFFCNVDIVLDGSFIICLKINTVYYSSCISLLNSDCWFFSLMLLQFWHTYTKQQKAKVPIITHILKIAISGCRKYINLMFVWRPLCLYWSLTVETVHLVVTKAIFS